METLEGITIYDGKITEIVQVFCPLCGYDRLELIINHYKCLRCGEIFRSVREWEYLEES